MKLFVKLLVSVLTCGILPSCDSQPKGTSFCNLKYSESASELNAYYQDSQRDHLEKALVAIEGAMACTQTRIKAVKLKISLLILLKNYQSGYQFIDSLTENDFERKYQKIMDEKYFLAMEYESKSDTTERTKLLEEIIPEIQSYIQKDKAEKNQVDELAYYDLFFIKTRVFGFQETAKEIDSLASRYPSEGNYFAGIKNTLSQVGEVP